MSSDSTAFGLGRSDETRDGERLRRDDACFRALLECLPLKIFVKDADQRFVACNAAFARDLGIRPDEVIGRTDDDFHASMQAARYRLEDQVVRLSGKSMVVQERTLQDGIEKIVQVSKLPFRDPDGAVLGVLGIIEDITERRQAERKLREFAYEIEDIYQHAPCGYLLLDAEGHVQRINATGLAWLGRSRDEVVGRAALDDLLSEASRERFAAVLAQIANGRCFGVRDVEVDLVRRDACLLPVRLNGTAIHDDEGNFAGLRLSFADIAEQRELERTRQAQARRLDELSHRLVAVQEEERRRLASALHDDVTPNLEAIRLTLNNLAHSLPASLYEEHREYLDDIEALARDAATRIRDVCTELRPPMLDYAGLVPAVESHLQQVARRTGLVITLEAGLADVALSRETESLLFRIVQEALANSVKHAFARNIRVVLKGDPAHTVLSVADDGVGFDPSMRTNPADQATDETRAVPGIGLISMQERAALAGGTMMVRSQPSGGTEIRVEFERLDRRARPARRASDRLASFAGSSAAGQIERRRNGVCRRRAEGSFPACVAPDFVERRAPLGGRRRQDRAAPDVAAQFRFS